MASRENRFILKNMVSRSCINLVKLYFKDVPEVSVRNVFLGEVTLAYDPDKIPEAALQQHFENIGFIVITDPDIAIVEKTKVAAIELIHYANNTNSLIRNSDYISERVQLPYEKISKVFSKVTNTTLEKYIILLKIEKAKELIFQNEITLSEISYMLGYSSVQYLSNQFKKVTGFTVSEFREQAHPNRIPLDALI